MAALMLLCISVSVRAQTVKSSGDCSPNIVGNRAPVFFRCGADDPRTWQTLRDLVLMPGVQEHLSATPEQPRGSTYERRFDLPAAQFTYDDLRDGLNAIRIVLLDLGGAEAALRSRETLIIGTADEAFGSVSLLRPTAQTLARIVSRPARGFEYAYDSPVGGVGRLVIAYRNAAELKVERSSDRSMLIVAEDPEKLAEAAARVREVFAKHASLQAHVADLIASPLVVIVFLCLGITLGPVSLLALLRIARPRNRTARLLHIASQAIWISAIIKCFALAATFPALVPTGSSIPLLTVLALLAIAVVGAIAAFLTFPTVLEE